MARFRLGLIIGFGAGFVVGSRQGREAYDRLSERLKEFTDRPEVKRFTDEVGERLEGVTSKVDDLLDRNGDGESGSTGSSGSTGTSGSTGSSASASTSGSTPGSARRAAGEGMGGGVSGSTEGGPGLSTPGGYQPGASPTGGPEANEGPRTRRPRAASENA